MVVSDEEIGNAHVGRAARADARRNLGALLDAAKAIFEEAGLDAPVRDIAKRAGVGVGTVYRHFPRRPDLIAAVFEQEIEACAEAAERLASDHPPIEALTLWLREFVKLTSTKRGLADALHSGDPAFDFIGGKRDKRLFPSFRALFDAAVASGEIRSDIDADGFLNAVATLCMSAEEGRPEQTLQYVMLLADGLRCRAGH